MRLLLQQGFSGIPRHVSFSVRNSLEFSAFRAAPVAAARPLHMWLLRQKAEQLVSLPSLTTELSVMTAESESPEREEPKQWPKGAFFYIHRTWIYSQKCWVTICICTAEIYRDFTILVWSPIHPSMNPSKEQIWVHFLRVRLPNKRQAAQVNLNFISSYEQNHTVCILC